METQNKAMNDILATIINMDGPALAHCLILSLVHNDALLNAVARDTIVCWAEHRFSTDELERVVTALYDGVFSPLMVMDSSLHPPRLILFGATNSMVEIRLSHIDTSMNVSSNVVFYATLVMLFRRHKVYAGHYGKLSHVWNFGQCFASTDLLQKCSGLLAHALRKNLCAFIKFDVDRWDRLWFSLHRAEYIPRDELRNAYQTMLELPTPCQKTEHVVPKIAAPVLKKKKISQDKQVLIKK